MPKTYEMSKAQEMEIEADKKRTKHASVYRKLEAVAMRANGKKNREIAEITGYSADRVSRLVSEYCRNGIGYFKEDHRKGGNHRNMTPEEERAFLKRFEEAAESGKQLTVGEMIKAYREIRPNAHQSTVYKLIHRHGWRKISPRPKHPKAASEEAQEVSKKLSNGATKLFMNYHN
jgi:transposase